MSPNRLNTFSHSSRLSESLNANLMKGPTVYLPRIGMSRALDRNGPEIGVMFQLRANSRLLVNVIEE